MTILHIITTYCDPEKVDIIYRRIDDNFIDPISFDSTSLKHLMPGLFDSYKSGNLNICSDPGGVNY